MPRKPDESRLSARELILALMDSAAAPSLASSYFVAAGGIFDMDPGSIRVALARLVRDGSLTTPERGRYGLGTRAGTLQSMVRNWSRLESSVVPWNGGWLWVLVGHLARTNKTLVRGNERSLKLFGFAEARAGLWVRPDNLGDGIGKVHSSLIALGLQPESLIGRVADFEPRDAVEPARLWDRSALEARYLDHLAALAASSERLPTLDETAAARETLLLGRQITRDILLDPLLPDELVDGPLRRRMVAAMRDYDQAGKSIWRAFYRRHQQAAGRGDGSSPSDGMTAPQNPAA